MKSPLKPAKQYSHFVKPSLPRSFSRKELDLLILAGCSCLMTLLYHPVADALQSTSSNASPTSISVNTSSQAHTMNAMGHLQVAKPSDHEGIVEEEE
jgi:hypothetical protein